MLISPAFAQDVASSAGPGFELLIMIGIFFVLMYFMIIRPQSKRNKTHKKLISELKDGDEVVTAGGILGVVIKIGETFLVLEIDRGSRMKIQKNSVAQVVPKGTFKDT